MRKIKNAKLFYTLFLISSLCQPAYSMEHKLIRCAKSMLPIREHHIASNSGELTSSSLQDLNFFRAYRLKDYSSFPSSKAISANSRSDYEEIQKVTSRITGILKEGGASFTEDPQTQQAFKQTMVGLSIKGADEIKNFLMQKLDTGKSIREEFSSDFNLQNQFTYLYNPLVVIMMGMAVSFMSPLTPPLLIGSRDYPEKAIRSFSVKHYGRNDEKALLAAIPKVMRNQNAWFYRSFDSPIPLEIKNRLWNRGEIDMGDVHLHWKLHESPKITYNLTGEKYYLDKVYKPVVSYIRVDQLLYFDKRDQAPRLMTFLRMSEKVPAYPEAATEQSEEFSDLKDSVPDSI